MKRLPVKRMSKSDQRIVGEWAKEHRKTVRQLTIRQTNTKHAAGTFQFTFYVVRSALQYCLSLNMYRKELPVGERIQQKNNHARENVRKKKRRKKRREKYHAQDRPHFDIEPEL